MLLKIVQGPNAGAEIVLVEGMTLSLGKGDACDILLADQSLADVACELEIDSERVRVLLPGGVEERLEPFHVKLLGETTAIAIGPEKGAWGELIWPTRGAAAATADEAEPESETAQIEAENSPKSSPKRAIRKWFLGLFLIVLLLLIAGVAAICYWPTAETWAAQKGVPVEKVKPTVHTSVTWCKEKGCELYTLARAYCAQKAPEEPPAPAPIRLDEMATGLGLTYEEIEGQPKISGNFATRAQRLSATASFYAAKPGVTLDLSDDESLRAAAVEVLDLVSEGKLQVHSARERALALMGYAPSATALRAVLEAIRADVPHVADIDCSRVTLGEATGVVEVEPTAQQPNVTAVKAAKAYRDGRKSLAPKMPVVGVVTVPYPCLVLKDGSRVTEGAEFGGFIIEKISADTIQIRGPEGTFEWRP
jgi:hypothetical protein